MSNSLVFSLDFLVPFHHFLFYHPEQATTTCFVNNWIGNICRGIAVIHHSLWIYCLISFILTVSCVLDGICWITISISKQKIDRPYHTQWNLRQQTTLNATTKKLSFKRGGRLLEVYLTISNRTTAKDSGLPLQVRRLSGVLSSQVSLYFITIVRISRFGTDLVLICTWFGEKWAWAFAWMWIHIECSQIS